jgi:hypothetical protein
MYAEIPAVLEPLAGVCRLLVSTKHAARHGKRRNEIAEPGGGDNHSSTSMSRRQVEDKLSCAPV